MLATVLHGFLVSGGLIVSIGAQNAFVLKQGLLKQHVFWICLCCFLCDFVLMVFGVLGFSSLISQSPTASALLSLVGAAFLLVYGWRALRSAYRGSSGLNADEGVGAVSVPKIIAVTLALTLLNPHVYLDTVVIIGGVAGTLNLRDKYLFLIGTLSASLLWFFSLGYGARLLTPLFKQPKTWRVLDVFVGMTMWLIGAGLLKYALQLWH